MGMFDWVTIKCRSCGKELNLQSKAGECDLTVYRLDTVPKEIAADIIGESINCSCGVTIEIRGKFIIWDEVRKFY